MKSFQSGNPRVSKDFVTQNAVPRWKRILDISCIALATPGLVPLGLLIAAGIKLVSPGPIFFKQARIGHLGRRFMCFKFRTMTVNADAGVHQEHSTRFITSNRPMTKLDVAGDSRLIFGGVILRSLGLDELPQVLNVLRGEMSLVGPRPCVPYEYEKYQPRHRQRCRTLPGLTGLWQISGKNRTTFEEMIDLDLRYVENKSPFWDLKIMALTIPAIFVQARETRRARKPLVQTVVLVDRTSSGQPTKHLPLGGTVKTVSRSQLASRT